eukprot:gene7146-7953_t
MEWKHKRGFLSTTDRTMEEVSVRGQGESQRHRSIDQMSSMFIYEKLINAESSKFVIVSISDLISKLLKNLSKHLKHPIKKISAQSSRCRYRRKLCPVEFKMTLEFCCKLLSRRNRAKRGVIGIIGEGKR